MCTIWMDSFFRLLKAKLDERVRTWRDMLAYCAAAVVNLQRRSRAFQIGEQHYDIGNDLYEHALDRRMIYSCGYWDKAATLDDAQTAKLDLVFNKLKLETGQSVLDVEDVAGAVHCVTRLSDMMCPELVLPCLVNKRNMHVMFLEIFQWLFCSRIIGSCMKNLIVFFPSACSNMWALKTIAPTCRPSHAPLSQTVRIIPVAYHWFDAINQSHRSMDREIYFSEFHVAITKTNRGVYQRTIHD